MKEPVKESSTWKYKAAEHEIGITSEYSAEIVFTSSISPQSVFMVHLEYMVTMHTKHSEISTGLVTVLDYSNVPDVHMPMATATIVNYCHNNDIKVVDGVTKIKRADSLQLSGTADTEHPEEFPEHSNVVETSVTGVA